MRKRKGRPVNKLKKAKPVLAWAIFDDDDFVGKGLSEVEVRKTKKALQADFPWSFIHRKIVQVEIREVKPRRKKK